MGSADLLGQKSVNKLRNLFLLIIRQIIFYFVALVPFFLFLRNSTTWIHVYLFTDRTTNQGIGFDESNVPGGVNIEWQKAR